MEQAYRIELWGDTVERISRIDPLTGNTIAVLDQCAIYPAKHFVTQRATVERAVKAIRVELAERLHELKSAGKLLEAQRLESRTSFDIEMLLEVGTCAGIENYSRHLTGRLPGERPACLIDYFPADYLVVVDESHVSLPQIGGMFNGDRARKTTLVEYGFRLPSALDNRPLQFDEFMGLVPQMINVSATPGEQELQLSGGVIVEQIIRPTGLVDPEVEIRPVKGQVDDLLHEIRARVRAQERVLVTTLTKRMSEDLTDYLQQAGVRVRYLHSDIDAIERMEILRGLRLGDFDVLVGINLLREGLDLPEVSLVAILDADQEGFLRSDRSLVQTIGRAARNVHGLGILYADRITGSMQRALAEMDRRRAIQRAYNIEHDITPHVDREVAGGSAPVHPRGRRAHRAGQARAGAHGDVHRPARPEAARAVHGAARASHARGLGQPRVRGGGAAARPAQRAPRHGRAQRAARWGRDGGPPAARPALMRVLTEAELGHGGRTDRPSARAGLGRVPAGRARGRQDHHGARDRARAWRRRSRVESDLRPGASLCRASGSGIPSRLLPAAAARRVRRPGLGGACCRGGRTAH